MRRGGALLGDLWEGCGCSVVEFVVLWLACLWYFTLNKERGAAAGCILVRLKGYVTYYVV